jgi:hypothetical protein
MEESASSLSTPTVTEDQALIAEFTETLVEVTH